MSLPHLRSTWFHPLPPLTPGTLGFSVTLIMLVRISFIQVFTELVVLCSRYFSRLGGLNGK